MGCIHTVLFAEQLAFFLQARVPSFSNAYASHAAFKQEIFADWSPGHVFGVLTLFSFHSSTAYTKLRAGYLPTKLIYINSDCEHSH